MSLTTSQGNVRANGPLARISKVDSKVVARRADVPNTAKTPTNDSLSSTAYSTNNYNNSGNNNDMDLAFDDVAEELKLLDIQSLKEAFEESHRDLQSQLQADLQKIADKKYQEYLRELEELNKHRKSEYEEALNSLSLKHHTEIKTYVQEIDLKQKELLEQIENFDKVKSKEFEIQIKKDHEELKDALYKLLGDMNSRSVSRSTVQIKPRRLGSNYAPKSAISVKHLPVNSNSRQLNQQKEQHNDSDEAAEPLSPQARWGATRGEGFARNRVDITALHNEIKQFGGRNEQKDPSSLSRESALQRRNEKTLPTPPSHLNKQTELLDNENEKEEPSDRRFYSNDIDRASTSHGRSNFNVEPQSRPSGGIQRANIIRPRQVATKEASTGSTPNTVPSWAAGRKRDLPEASIASNELERTSGRLTSNENLERTSGRMEPNSAPLFVERDAEKEELDRTSASPRRDLPRASTRDGQASRILHKSPSTEGIENCVVRPSRPMHNLTSASSTASDDDGGESSTIRMSNENIQLSRNPGKPRDVPVETEGEGDSFIPRASKRSVPLRSQGSYNSNNQQQPSLPPSWKKERPVETGDSGPLSPSGQRERPVPSRRNLNNPSDSNEPLSRESNIRNMNREPLSPRQGLPRNWPINKNTDTPPPTPNVPTPTMPSIPTIPLSSTSTQQQQQQSSSNSPRSTSSTSSNATISPRPKPLPPPKSNEPTAKAEQAASEPEPVAAAVESVQVTCGLCKLSFDENETVLLKEVNRNFCLPCSNDVIERARIKGLTLTRVTK